MLDKVTTLDHPARVTAFEICKTFIWFTILPVNKLMQHFTPRRDEPNYEITVNQYFYLPAVGLSIYALTMLLAMTLYIMGIPVILAGLIAGFCYNALYGHIHMEGLSDTIDALHAFPRKDPLTVLTEPYAGALGNSYSNTANNLMALFLATIFYLSATVNPMIAIMPIMIIAYVRVMPAFIILEIYKRFYPDGWQGIRLVSKRQQTILGSVMLPAYATICGVTITIAAYILNPSWHDSISMLSLGLLAGLTGLTIGYLTVIKITRYLRVVYGDILGTGIIVGELTGFAMYIVGSCLIFNF